MDEYNGKLHVEIEGDNVAVHVVGMVDEEFQCLCTVNVARGDWAAFLRASLDAISGARKPAHGGPSGFRGEYRGLTADN